MNQTTQTNPAGQDPAVVLPQLPQFPSGQEVYDAIMGQIEPELTSRQLPTLQQKYATETAEESQERQARYDKAFAEYGKRYSAFSEQLAGQVHSFQRIAISAAEMSTKADEEDGLAAIASSIASA